MVADPLVEAVRAPSRRQVEVELDALDTSGHTDLERQTLTGHRWWPADALAGTDEMIYPDELSTRLPEVIAILRPVGRRPTVVRRRLGVARRSLVEWRLPTTSHAGRPARRTGRPVRSATNRYFHGGSASFPSIGGPSVIEPLAAPESGCARALEEL